MAQEFEQLIHQQSGRIMAIARRYVGPGEQHDLYQEILEQLWRSFGSFRAEARPETWVYRIGLNTAITGLRKQSRQPQTTVMAPSELPEGAQPAGRDQAQILEEFMALQNDVDRSILMMYLDGLSGKEMASVTGIKVNAIQVRINRLKTDFAARYVEDAPCS